MPKRTRSHRHSSRPVRSKAFVSKRAAMLGLILVIALIFAAALCFKPNASNTPSAVSVIEISAEEAYQQSQQGAFILDVREVEEWNAFHIPGTALIPLGQLGARVNEVPRDRQVVVVCRSGNRSRSGAKILMQAGFTEVSSMAGGVPAWSDAGYPIEGTRP